MLSNNNNLVELLGSPAPNTTVHQWVPKNVKSMNRRNKMSSEVFRVPSSRGVGGEEDGVGGYEFRLVLLRGVVRADSELDDPLAVFLEYIPSVGTTDYTHAAASGVTHPEGCKVAVWCVQSGRVPASSSKGSMFAAGELEEEGASIVPTRLQLPRGDPHLFTEETFTFNGSTKMLGFKEFIPATIINNDCFVDPSALNAMIIRVEITTGVSSVADVVARTTDRWTSSLWGSATSVFAVVQASIDVVSSNVKGWLDGEVEGRTEQVNNGEEPSIESQRGLPWGELPPKWSRAGKTLEDWAALITIQLPEDEGTFLFGAERGINPDEQVLMTQIGLQHRQILSAASVFDYDRDVHEGLLTCSRIRKQRYELVPGRIADERFWANYMWKVAALATCTSQDQVKLILAILNAPPAPSPRRGSRDASLSRPTNASRGGVLDDSFNQEAGGESEGVGGVATAVDMDVESVLASHVGAAVREALEVKDVLFELLEGYKDTRGADAESDEVLIQSAKKSCEKQRERLVLLMGRASVAAKKRGESEQDCALCAGLHSTLRSVDDAVESIETTLSLVRSLQQDGSGSSAAAEDNDDEPTTPVVADEANDQAKQKKEDAEEQYDAATEDTNEEEGAKEEAPTTVESETFIEASNKDQHDTRVEETVLSPQTEEVIDTNDQVNPTTPPMVDAPCVWETTPEQELVKSPAPEPQEEEDTVDVYSQVAVQEITHPVVTTTTPVVVDDGSDFDELPDIDATSPTGVIHTAHTQHVDPQTTAASTPLTASVTSPTGSMASKGGASARKIEFEPMPWDDED